MQIKLITELTTISFKQEKTIGGNRQSMFVGVEKMELALHDFSRLLGSTNYFVSVSIEREHDKS